MGLACRAEGEQSGWWGHGASLQAQTLLVTSAGGPAGPGCPAGALVPQEELGSDAGCVGGCPGGRERPVVTEQSPLASGCSSWNPIKSFFIVPCDMLHSAGTWAC